MINRRLTVLALAAGLGVGCAHAPEKEIGREDLVQNFRQTKFYPLRNCYEAELKFHPSVEGTVWLRFDIEPTGEVANASIRHDPAINDQVTDCMLGLMKGWTFPYHPPEAVPIEWPLKLRPKNGR